MMQYASLEQRIARHYLDLLAPFVPGPDIDPASQEEFHRFVSGFLQRIYDQPETFFTRLHEDDAHPNRFNCASYGKPDLKKNMRIAFDKIKEHFLLLIKIGWEGEVRDGGIAIPFKPGRKEQKQLDYLGLQVDQGIVAHPDYPRMAAAWHFLAQKTDPYSLKRCWFDDAYPYLEKTFARFYDPAAYEALVSWLHENGYRSYVSGVDWSGIGSPTMLDFAKCVTAEEKPLGYAIHGDKFHYGFTFEYRYEPQIPQHTELRILRFKDILQRFEEMPVSARGLIKEKVKRCNGCGYCNQTDKTGKRPRATVTMSDGEGLCPYYPGYDFLFTELDMQRVGQITEFLLGMEKLIKELPADRRS